ncbi:MAG: HEPN domain-containing protein [Ardenticatenaceae bacterium]
MRNGPVEEGRRWLRQAQADLGWTQHLAQEGGYHLACFLAQQVTENALKAFLYAQGQEVVLGHSVTRLCEVAATYNPEFAARARSWKLLDSYYIPTRYPNGLPDGIPADVYTAEAAADAVGLAAAAVEFVATLLTDERDS